MTFAAETLLADLASEFGRAVAESRPVAIENHLYGLISLALTGIAVELGRLRAERDRAAAGLGEAISLAQALRNQIVAERVSLADHNGSGDLPAGVVRLPTRRIVPIRVPEGGQPA